MVIGGGHHGLSLGAYFAGAGLKTVVLERRHEMGGGLSTEEVTEPGFYHNLHSNFHGAYPMMPQYKDFQLEELGLKYYHPEANIGMPLKDGRCLVLYVDEMKTYEEIEKFSKNDADQYAKLKNVFSEHLDLVMRGAYSPLSTGHYHEMLDIVRKHFGENVTEKSPYEWVKEYFEDPHVQAVMLYHVSIAGFDITQKGLAHLGLGYLSLTTNWQLCRGGSHYFAHCLGSALLKRGGDIIESAPAQKIIIEDGRAVAVAAGDGYTYAASKAIVSAIDPHQTFVDLIDAKELDQAFLKKVKKIEYGKGDALFGLHLALREAPKYTSAKYNPDMDMAFNLNIGYETAEDIAEHFEESARNELPKHPRLNCSVNTLFDPTQAPDGYHTGLMWQFAPFELGKKGSAGWDDVKDDFSRKCIEVWREYAPNLTDENIISYYPYTPHDIAQKMVNMRRGGFHITSITPDQFLEGRPIPELNEYRTPIEGLYMGGSSQHGQGGIIGAASYNAMQIVGKDLGILDKLPLGDKFWDRESDS